MRPTAASLGTYYTVGDQRRSTTPSPHFLRPTPDLNDTLAHTAAHSPPLDLFQIAKGSDTPALRMAPKVEVSVEYLAFGREWRE